MKKKNLPKGSPGSSPNGEPKEKPDQEFQHETPHEHQNEEGIPGKHAQMIPPGARHFRSRYSQDSGRSL